MTISPPRNHPRPVLIGRYRYSKLRWRAIAYALDFVGGLLVRLWRLVRPKPTVQEVQRLLLVQLDHLGDAILSTPMLPRLRAAFPRARIDVLASSSNCAVFEADPTVNRVIVAQRNWFERRPAAWALGTAVWHLGRLLRKERYDLGIDVRGDLLSVLVLALAGIPKRVGWRMGGGGWLMTDLAQWTANRHEVASRLALLDLLGANSGEPPRPYVSVSDPDRAFVARGLEAEWPQNTPAGSRMRHPILQSRSASRDAGVSRVRNSAREPVSSREAELADPELLHAGRFGAIAPLLAVHLGAGTAAKRWPLNHWNHLVGRFLHDGWRVIVVGGPDEAALRLSLPPHANLRDWTTRLSVTQTTALLERADLFIGADSGPAHLAACAAVPSIVLFSGTNQVRQWRPWSRASLVLRKRVPCHPCHRKTCPLADHPCLTALQPERVYRAAMCWWRRLHALQSPLTAFH